METGSLSQVSGSFRLWGVDQRAEHTNLCPHEVHLHSNETRQIISDYIISAGSNCCGRKQWKRERGVEWQGGKTAVLSVLSSLIECQSLQLVKDVSVSFWMLGIALQGPDIGCAASLFKYWRRSGRSEAIGWS